MKGGVTLPIHKEFIHPSTFGATHQGVLWQHPVPKDARFFGSNFLWAILVNVVTSSRLRKIIWFMEMARVVRLLRKATTIYDAFLRSSCHGRLVRNGMFCFFGWKSWDVKTSNALRSRHMHTTRDADWSILEDLEVWSEWTPWKNQRGAEKEVWKWVTPCPTRLFGRKTRLAGGVVHLLFSPENIKDKTCIQSFLNQIPSKPTGTEKKHMPIGSHLC